MMRVWVIKNDDDLYVSSDTDELNFVERPLARRWEDKEAAGDYSETLDTEYSGTLSVVSLKVKDRTH